MSFLWESVKVTAQMAGNAAKVAGQKTKLKGEVILVDREIVARKRQFGVELYDYVSPLASNPDFFAADDKMTNTVRGPMLKTQREIAALLQKRTKLKEKLAQAEVTRKAAFPTAAANIGEKMMNTGKAAGFAANETKIQTEIGMIDTQINVSSSLPSFRSCLKCNIYFRARSHSSNWFLLLLNNKGIQAGIWFGIVRSFCSARRQRGLVTDDPRCTVHVRPGQAGG